MRKIMYLHILWHNDIKFIPQLVALINQNAELESSKHFFITPYKDTYEKIKHYPNTKLVDNCNLINKYGNRSNWIFVHSINGVACGFIRFLFIKNKFAKKIIWRTWGHDVLRYHEKEENLFIANLKKIYFKLRANKIKKFKLIGIANIVDELRIKEEYKNVKTIFMPYTTDKNIDSMKYYFDNMSLNDIPKIMVGHYGDALDNHINIIKQLLNYKNDMIISLVLSYGNNEYINNVIQEARKIVDKNHLEIITDYMDYSDYLKYISTIDVAILSAKHSNALGTLRLLAYYEKKIYLNSSGDIAKGLAFRDCVVNDIQDIGKITFEDFIYNSSDNKKKMKEEFGHIYYVQNNIHAWKLILDELNK